LTEKDNTEEKSSEEEQTVDQGQQIEVAEVTEIQEVPKTEAAELLDGSKQSVSHHTSNTQVVSSGPPLHSVVNHSMSPPPVLQPIPQQWTPPYQLHPQQYQGMPVQHQLQAVLQGNRMPIPPPEIMYPPNPMMLPLAQNPTFLTTYPTIPPKNSPDSYIWIYNTNGQRCIGYNKEGGFPPLVVNEKADCVEIEISLFQLGHSVHYQGNWIYIHLFQNLQVSFFVPTLLDTAPSKEHTAELVISVALDFFDIRLVDIAVSRTVMLITLPRRHPLGPPSVNSTPGPNTMDSKN